MVDQHNTTGFNMANPDDRKVSRTCHSRKRTRDSSQSGTDEGNDEFEIPAKKRKVFEQWLKSSEDNLPHEICLLGESTPKRSPIDSSYGSVGKSPYVSHPSVGASSGIELSPRSLNIRTPSFKESASFAEFLCFEKQFQSHSDLEELFRRHYKVFKAELDPKHNLADKLFQMRILSRETKEQLSEERSRRRRADIFIKALVHDSRARIPDIYNKVISVFHEEKIDYLLNNEGKSTTKARALKMDWLSEGKSFLISELQFLAKGLQDHLEPWDIIDDLLISGSLSFADHEDIYKATARHDRVRILIDHVKRAGKHHFHHFIEALNIKYPKLTKQLRDTHLLPAQELKPQLHRNDNGNNKDQIITAPISHGPTMMELKLKFGPEPVKDVEMSVVEYNTSRLNLSLEEEVMEVAGISIEEIKFSSVKITFAARSDDALSKFKEAINDPLQLQRILTRMMTQEQLQNLKDRNVQSIKVEILIPEGSIINSKCTCKLSKEIIVQSYTYLVENILDPTSMIDAFAKSNLLQETVKSDLLNLKENDLSSALKTDSFLMMLLTFPDECICFFEKQLRRINQEHLIEKLIEKKASEPGSGDSFHISPKDIRRNMSYLVEEIEPKMFLSIFETTDAKLEVEEIISTDSREKRSKLFLRCMLKAGPKAIGKFHRELVRRGMNYVIDVLCIKDTQYENLCSNILKCYSKLLEEIEPTRLRDKLVQEGVFKAKEFEEIFKISLWRRDRVVWLLRKLLRKDQRAIAVFIDCLKIANYDDIVKSITDSKDELVDCPFLTSKIQKENGITANGKDFDFSADFNIQWIEETRSESDLQLSLHKEIYKRNDEKTVDRTEFTKSWIVSQSAVTETDDQTSTIGLKKGAHEMNVCEKENYDTLQQGPKIAEVLTNDGDSCIKSNKIPIECTQQCVAQATGGDSADISSPASKPAVSRYEQSVSLAEQIEEYHDQIPSPCMKECEDTRHYILPLPSLVDCNNSPVGSEGTSCYSNDFEDISPCPSPVSCMDGEAVTPLQPFNFNICYVDEPSAYSSNSPKLLPSPYFIKGSPNGKHLKPADRFASAAKERLQTFNDSKTTKMNSCYNKWLSTIFKRLEKTGTAASTCQLRYKRGGCNGRKARKFTALEK